MCDREAPRSRTMAVVDSTRLLGGLLFRLACGRSGVYRLAVEYYYLRKGWAGCQLLHSVCGGSQARRGRSSRIIE